MGDALGSQFFVPANYPLLKRRELPPGPWQWTDDTEMACSVLAVLADHGRDRPGRARPLLRRAPRLRPRLRPRRQPDAAADPGGRRLARAGRRRSSTGRARGATAPRCGSPRSAPGTPDDPEQATHQAEISAYTTHQHREAVVGAMAVAAAAALAADPAGPPTARGPARRRHRARAAQRRGGRAAAGAGHARLRRRRHGRRGARLRPAYQRARHRAVRAVVGRAAARRLSSGRSGRPPRWAGTWTPPAPSSAASWPPDRPARRRAEWLERTEALPAWVPEGRRLTSSAPRSRTARQPSATGIGRSWRASPLPRVRPWRRWRCRGPLRRRCPPAGRARRRRNAVSSSARYPAPGCSRALRTA